VAYATENVNLKRLEHPFWPWYDDRPRQGTPISLRELNAPGSTETVAIEPPQEEEVRTYLEGLGFSAADKLPVEFVA